MDQQPVYDTEKSNREAQMLTEEKWIIDTLYRVKKQQNAVNIEKLRLECMTAEIKNKTYESPGEKIADISAAVESVGPYISTTVNEIYHMTVAIHKMQNDPSLNRANVLELAGTSMAESENRYNEAQDNLMSNHQIYDQPSGDWDYDMEDSDSDDDDDDSENIEMEMKMLTIDEKDDEEVSLKWPNDNPQSADCAFDDDSD